MAVDDRYGVAAVEQMESRCRGRGVGGYQFYFTDDGVSAVDAQHVLAFSVGGVAVLIGSVHHAVNKDPFFIGGGLLQTYNVGILIDNIMEQLAGVVFLFTVFSK